MTLIEVEDWLETFPTKITGLRSVAFGDEQEILTRQASQIKYPVMWVETPNPTMVADPPGTRLRIGLTFLSNVPIDTNRKSRLARSGMLAMAQAAWLELEKAQEAGRFQFESKVEEGDAILRWSGDNDTGWRFEAVLTIGRDDC